jgi:serine/threonine-protein kinase
MIGQDDGRHTPAEEREAPHVVDEASRILAGRYEVGDLIGRGGMAEVHIGYDRRLGRTVAIKILRSDLARDPSFQNRFRREAQSAAALNHPAIVAVYDTGEDVITEPTGVVAHVPFIVMEYVEGHTVRDILQDGAAVPIDEALEITAGVLSALEYSHHAGIVHRDIKPANVMLTPTGAVKVMDFGIARAMADSAATMTQTQAVIGTAQYLSPEQARGETVDARSDLYSTGCLLFELLTGRPPFTGDSPVAVAYQHVRENPPAPSAIASDVPEALDRVVLKSLAKDREARYQTADEFRSDLEAVLHGAAVNAPAVAAYGAALATIPMGAADATQVMAPATGVTQALPPALAGSPWAATGLATPGGGTGYRDDEQGGRPWVIWVLLLVALLAVGAIIAVLLNNNRGSNQPTTVAVPDVVNLSVNDATSKLNQAQLNPVRQEIADPTVPKDHVVKTDPIAGKQVAPRSDVKFYVSTGPATNPVPNVVGQPVDQAARTLTGANFTIDPTQVQDNNPKYPAGQVTATDPPAGTAANAGQAIKLSVSTGNVDLPDLKGMAQADALAKLNSLNLVAVPQNQETPDSPANTVISQDRTGLVPQGTKVTLVIAQAPTTATVPDVAGLSYNDAVTKLAAAGLKTVTQQPTASEQVPSGQVMYTSPAKGIVVGLNQPITVFVSTGPSQAATAALPDVSGKTYNEAKNLLNQAGYTNITAVPSQSGNVSSQTPAPNQTYPAGTPITLTMK